MKVCTKTHQVKGFGEIPEGSRWDDDSPYLTKANARNFVDEADYVKPKPTPAKESS